MHRFHRMHEQRWTPGGIQSGGNFARDDSTLAHTRHYHASATGVEQFHGAIESLSHVAGNPIGERTQCLRLDTHHVLADVFHGRLDVSKLRAEKLTGA